MPSFSKYRISTITATAYLNSDINLDILYNSLFDKIKSSRTEHSIFDRLVYVEFGKKRYNIGHLQKFLNRQERMQKSTVKRFDNQVTMVYKTIEGNVTSMINAKIFKNGNIQMTGVRYIQQGKEMAEHIISIIKSLSNEDNIMANIDALEVLNFKLRLINSDFKVDYDINREALYKLLYKNYDASCSFEPCIYPAVKLKYYFNEDNLKKDGHCRCSSKCMIGKGVGIGDQLCKKVTIAIFQSGCVIITGGQSLEQVAEAYSYITTILNDNENLIKKKMIMVPVSRVESESKKIIYVKASNIIDEDLS